MNNRLLTRALQFALPRLPYNTEVSTRKNYERWFEDVRSSRNFEPPRIQLGTPHENPTTLTRQDWRGPNAGWAEDSLGYWEVDVASAVRYEVMLRTAPAPEAGEARFSLNGASARLPLGKSATECRLDSVRLPAGKGRLEASVSYGAREVGVRFVDVRGLARG